MSAPKQDSDEKLIFLRVVGGEAPGSTLAQRVGPLGISAKVVGEDIKKVTAKYQGMKVGVLLRIKDRKAAVEVILSTANLVIEALNEPPRDRKKVKNINHSGDLSMTDIVIIGRKVATKAYSKTLTGTVKQVLGTCLSVGCTVEGKNPKTVIREINEGMVTLPAE
ncbi:60S ribosomal protein L12 [Spraguea lophii 42_110]|uniref:60S ribosomal protein L12 n=1 Tax=Spraguea lophii (strain 42_110) TaxID=1358809 RepID=S7W9J9_SPRLO|nr:60S ribosomal protein L12 [Spraguea lophii 42_110]